MKTPISNTINHLHAVEGRRNTAKYVQDGSIAGAIAGGDLLRRIRVPGIKFAGLPELHNLPMFPTPTVDLEKEECDYP
jgi:hypothetical protein